jgi:protein-disulfide isomerase
MRCNRLALVALACISIASSSFGQSPAQSSQPDQAQLLKSTEAFIRNLFTWGPEYTVKLGPLLPSPSQDFYTVTIEVSINGQTNKGSVYVSRDGKTFLRGDLYSMSADPFAEDRAKLKAGDSPSKGPANARVTLFAFSDFECPHCLELHKIMKDIEAKYPQVRFVYKDFPLTQIHPWAESAAIGARCAFQQSPAAYWKVSDDIFANQDLISATNVWDKLVDFASAARLDADTFKSCMASPEAKKAVDDSQAEGVALGITGTPAVFVNARPVSVVSAESISQFIDFELAAQKN